MRRPLLTFLAVLCLLVPLAPGLSAQSAVRYETSLLLSWELYVSSPFTWASGSIDLLVQRGTDGLETATASGNVSHYDGESETWHNFPSQTVPASSLVTDPLGNSATLGLQLVDHADEPVAFSLELTRPQTFVVQHPQTSWPGVNFWADPGAGQVGANALAALTVERTAYAGAGSLGEIEVDYSPTVPNCTPAGCFSLSVELAQGPVAALTL